MSTYKSLMAQANALRRKAEAQRQNQIHSVVADIKKKMSTWGISVEDLSPLVLVRQNAPRQPSGLAQPKVKRSRQSIGTRAMNGLAGEWLRPG
jgi:DNA-binding protein H-NS